MTNETTTLETSPITTLGTFAAPYITFNGNCREAMKYYQSVFGGELLLQAVKDMPVAGQCPESIQNDIMHSQLNKGHFMIMASDMIGHSGYQKGNNFSICVHCSSKEEIRNYYNSFAANGRVLDELKEQFWGALFGVVEDQFGVRWLFNFPLNNQ